MVNAVKNKTFNLHQMDSFSSMRSHQALQASALVGRQVFVPNDGFFLKPEGGIRMAIDIPMAINTVSVFIQSISGEPIKTFRWEEKAPGFFQFEWDGRGDNNERQVAGQYKLKALGLHEEQTVHLNTLIAANVNSVSLGENGKELQLNVSGIGLIGLKGLKFL